MFDNIGSKIKTLAKIITVVGIAISVIWGLVIMINAQTGTILDGGIFFSGIIVIVLGSLISWISSFFMYGFGQLIESTQNIEETLFSNTYYNENKTAEKNKTAVIKHYENKQIENEQIENRQGENTEEYTWTCPRCGKINKSVTDTDTCSCGYSPY